VRVLCVCDRVCAYVSAGVVDAQKLPTLGESAITRIQVRVVLWCASTVIVHHAHITERARDDRLVDKGSCAHALE
jgi:hypothetical protein